MRKKAVSVALNMGAIDILGDGFGCVRLCCTWQSM